MPTKKKTTSPKKIAPKKSESSKVTASQKVTAPKKTSSKKETVKSEVVTEEVSSSRAPKFRIITKKYLYAVAAVLAVIGLLFAASRLWVIAWIDNKPLTKFELYSLLEKRDEGKTTEELIEQKLLMSEASKQRQSVSDAEVNGEIAKIQEQQGGADQLNQILSLQRISQDDFRNLVKLQLIKQKLFGGGINITDQDVQAYIDQNKDALPANILSNPESSEAAKLKEDVKEQLKQIKINENYNKWLEEAMRSSRVMRSS